MALPRVMLKRKHDTIWYTYQPRLRELVIRSKQHGEFRIPGLTRRKLKSFESEVIEELVPFWNEVSNYLT